jgi:hypothetical protein
VRAVVSFLVLVFVVGCIGILHASPVVAQGGSSWATGTPTVVQDIEYPVTIPTGCSGIVQSHFVSELDSTKSLCVYGNSQLEIGTFQENYTRMAVVKFPLSNTFHELEGVCRGAPCVYSPHKDMIVTQQPVGRYSLGIVVYLSVSQRIKTISTTPGIVQYVFDTAHPDYEMKNEIGTYIWNPTFAISENGDWIVAELRGAGLALVNTDTFSGRQITTSEYGYGYGMDPSIELAVSNDGTSVAHMGLNAGFSIISIDDGCGQVITGNPSKLSATRECASRGLPTGSLFPNFNYARQPRFYGSGAELEVIVLNWNQPMRKVTFLAHGAESVPKLRLLTLGDSFTSGEGETDEGFYLNGTNDGYDTCHLSRRSYPPLVGAMLGMNVTDARSVACAGARVGDLFGVSGSYWGQGGRLGESGKKLSVADKMLAQRQALDSFQPGWALQADFIERYRPEKLLLGVGGNDAGLMGKLAVCAAPGTCEWAEPAGIRATTGEIHRLKSALGRLYAMITQRFPETEVFVVGYPNIMDLDGPCDPLTGILFDQKERMFIKSSMSVLNRTIQEAAVDAGLAFVDVQDSLSRRNICGMIDQSAMNALRLGDDSAVIASLPMLKIIGSETFHPTPAGHTLIAQRILNQYPDLDGGLGCQGQPLPCAAANDTELPIEWITSAQPGEQQSYYEDFASKAGDINGDSREFEVSMPRGSFEPGSSIRIEIRSEDIELTTLLVDADGALTATLSVPEVVVDGFHTLHLLGVSTEGQPIDVYQFVTVGNATDASSGEAKGGKDEGSPQAVDEGVYGGREIPTDSSVEESTSPEVSDIEGGIGGTVISRSKGSGVAGVLGLATIAVHDPLLDSSIEKLSSIEYDAAESDTSKLPLYVIGVLLAMIVLIGVLLQRRWAKRHSWV